MFTSSPKSSICRGILQIGQTERITKDAHLDLFLFFHHVLLVCLLSQFCFLTYYDKYIRACLVIQLGGVHSKENRKACVCHVPTESSCTKQQELSICFDSIDFCTLSLTLSQQEKKYIMSYHQQMFYREGINMERVVGREADNREFQRTVFKTKKSMG